MGRISKIWFVNDNFLFAVQVSRKKIQISNENRFYSDTGFPLYNKKPSSHTTAIVQLV